MTGLSDRDPEGMTSYQRFLQTLIDDVKEIIAEEPEKSEDPEWMVARMRAKRPLASRLRELAFLQVMYVKKPLDECVQFVEFKKTAGLHTADLLAIPREMAGEESGLPPLERAILQAAREMMETRSMSDDLRTRLAEDLSPEALQDLTDSVAFCCDLLRFDETVETDDGEDRPE